MVREIFGRQIDNLHYILTIHTANSAILDSYISRTIGDMESIMERKIVQNEIFNMIDVLKKIFTKMGAN